MEAKDRIIIPLDVKSVNDALELVEMLQDYVWGFKVGLELFSAEGPDVIKKLKDFGAKNIFFDGKWMDIPNTVAGAARAIVKLGVQMVNVHTLGGHQMMAETMRAVYAEVSDEMKRPKVLGVTILTSLAYEDLVEMGIFDEVVCDPMKRQQVMDDRIENLIVEHLTQSAWNVGLDGVIASPKEIKAIRHAFGWNILIVTPGVRPVWAAANDQKRVMTPYEAILAGADLLVIGRPITNPPESIGTPVDAAKKIAEEIQIALDELKTKFYKREDPPLSLNETQNTESVEALGTAAR